jgi:hypothetical protein
METYKAQFEAIIKKHLPNFWFSISDYKGYFGGVSLAIMIAPIDFDINGIRNQKPQMVSLSFDPKTLELEPQAYAGCGGRCIERKPDLTNPNEKYLYCKSVKVAFRTPQKNEKAVLSAFEKFVIAYKKALIDNIDVLMNQEIVDYRKVLNI